MLGCSMTKVVARHLGVFSFFYFFLKRERERPVHFHWNYLQGIRNNNNFQWNNIMYSKTKKEESLYILHLYLNLAIRRAYL